MVTLVSSNTVFLSQRELGYAAAGGFLISALWWSSSSAKRPDVAFGALVYGCGAGLGTLTGALVAHWLV